MFTFSKRLAQIATDLMGVKGVRLYHDQALYKEPSGGITPWHADQYYWPLNSNHTVTAWIPLQATPSNMGPLAFAQKSQSLSIGRDIEISDDSEAAIARELKLANLIIHEEPFELGEISFHSGWTFHRAGVNSSDQARKVMTMIYMDKDCKVASPVNHNQQKDWDKWLPGLAIGDVAASKINPLLFSY